MLLQWRRLRRFSAAPTPVAVAWCERRPRLATRRSPTREGAGANRFEPGAQGKARRPFQSPHLSLARPMGGSGRDQSRPRGEEALEFVGRHRLGEGVALQYVATEVAKQPRMLHRLDPFGDDLNIERLAD